jgi:hypothetical protein
MRGAGAARPRAAVLAARRARGPASMLRPHPPHRPCAPQHRAAHLLPRGEPQRRVCRHGQGGRRRRGLGGAVLWQPRQPRPLRDLKPARLPPPPPPPAPTSSTTASSPSSCCTATSRGRQRAPHGAPAGPRARAARSSLPRCPPSPCRPPRARRALVAPLPPDGPHARAARSLPPFPLHLLHPSPALTAPSPCTWLFRGSRPLERTPLRPATRSPPSFHPPPYL